MNEPARELSVSYSEYLAREQASETKHEFLNGEIVTMASSTPEHACLTARVGGVLGALIRGRPCEAFSSNLRGRVLATGLATYPDVSVVCAGLATSGCGVTGAITTGACATWVVPVLAQPARVKARSGAARRAKRFMVQIS